MNVLLCGARGFVGRAARAALERGGHRVIAGVHGAPGPGEQAHDFARDIDPAAWLPRLREIDAVVNTVGVLRDAPDRPLAAIHAQAPAALFEACARAGVRRVVQVSALGVADSPTDYARTKRAADETLEALAIAGRVDAAIVRPSLVFGRGGASSRLFLALARLPALLLPAAVRRARVQPLAVGELAEALAALVERPAPGSATLAAVGPEPVGLGDFIASLRAQGGRVRACVGTLPDALARTGARLGDRVPASPWCSETLALLATDNVAEPGPFARVLGRTPARYDRLLAGVAP